MRLYFINFCSRQVDDFRNAGFLRNCFQIVFDFPHGFCNKRKPDIEIRITLIIMSNACKTIYDFCNEKSGYVIGSQ